MHDRPDAIELIAAARQYLEKDLIPSLSDQRLRFQTLVTANVLSIVERELAGQELQLADEWICLARILGIAGSPPERLSNLRAAVRSGNIELCRRIREGDFDSRERFLKICVDLRRLVEHKLKVANPRYLAGFYGESQGA